MQQLEKGYKLPEEWSIINLGDHLELRSGKSNPSKNLADCNPIPVYGGNGITGFYTDYLMKESTIVIGRVGEYCGSVNLTKGKAWITDNAIYISNLDVSINVTYLYYFLLLYNVGKFAEKTGQPKLTQLPIKQIKIPLPPFTEQQKVASILSKVDYLIQKTDQVIEQTQRLKKGLMKRLLSKGIGHTEFQEVIWHHGKKIVIPKAWKVVLLDEVAHRGTGHTPDAKKPEYYNGGIKWVSLADSHRLDNLYISETTKEISQKGIENSSAVKRPAGTVIMSRDAGVGKSTIKQSYEALRQISESYFPYTLDQMDTNEKIRAKLVGLLLLWLFFCASLTLLSSLDRY